MSAELTHLITVQVIDCELPDVRTDFYTWLIACGASPMLAQQPGRYVVIFSFDTKSDPRYQHAIDYLIDFAGVRARVALHIHAIEHAPGLPSPCMVDFRFRLNPADRACLDADLDARLTEQLRRVRHEGTA